MFNCALLILLLVIAVRLPDTTVSNNPTTTPSTGHSSIASTLTTYPSTQVETDITTLPTTTEPTQPPTLPPTQPPTEPPTQPPTTQPSTLPPTDPSIAPGNDEMIGDLYTRGYLQTLDTKQMGYGQGTAVGKNNRPLLPQQLKDTYGHWGAHFIGEDKPVIYLTFNCSYDYDNNTGKILDILKEKNVKAVFFINRLFLTSYPDLVQRIISEGHVLANHCRNHPELPQMSIDEIVEQIQGMHDLVLDGYGYEMKHFRPPSCYFSEQVLAIAQSLGYDTWFFSYTYPDWDPNDPPNETASLNKLVNHAHNGVVYQLHPLNPTNAAIMDDFIDAMYAAGYTFDILP